MKEKILNIISGITKISVEDLETRTGEPRPWNSLAHIELIIGLEDGLGITFSEDELAELVSVSMIIEVVERKVA